MKQDIVTYLQTRVKSRLYLVVFWLIALEPILNAVIGRALKGKWFLGDFDAVICGAHTVAQNLSPYSKAPVCEGLKPATYVYAPQIAQVLAPLVEFLGPAQTRLAYAVLLIPATLLLLWYMVLKPLPNGPFVLRLLSLMAFRGTPLATGNLGGLLHGAIVLASLFLLRWRWLFIAVVLMAALVKPLFLSALLVLLYEDRPLRRRLITLGTALLSGLLLVFYIQMSAGPLAGQWHELLTQMIHEDPGRGLFSALIFLHLPINAPISLILMGIYVVAMVLAGLSISTFGGLNRDERCLLGLGIGQFINPRLFDYNYDMFVFYPVVIIVIMSIRSLRPKAFYYLGWGFAWTIIANFLISIIGIKWFKDLPATFIIFSGMIFYVACQLFEMHKDRVFQTLERN